MVAFCLMLYMHNIDNFISFFLKENGSVMKLIFVSIFRTEYFFPEADNQTSWLNSSMSSNLTGEPYLIVIGTPLRTNKHYYKVWTLRTRVIFWMNMGTVRVRIYEGSQLSFSGPKHLLVLPSTNNKTTIRSLWWRTCQSKI